MGGRIRGILLSASDSWFPLKGSSLPPIAIGKGAISLSTNGYAPVVNGYCDLRAR